MHRGFVKIWRKAEDSQSWSRGIEYRGLIVSLVMRANHKPGFFAGQRIERGQFACGMGNLADDLGISRHKLLRMLKALKNDDLIEVKAHSRFSVVTICNYSTYQDAEAGHRTTTATTTATASAQQAHNRRTQSKNDKNEKNEKKYVGKGRKAALDFAKALPEDWRKPEMLELVESWAEARKKKPTQRAVDIALSQCAEYFSYKQTLERLQQAIVGGWSGLVFSEDKERGARRKPNLPLDELGNPIETGGEREPTIFDGI